MKKLLLSLFLVCFASSAFALNAGEKRVVAMLKSGDLHELKAAAKQIHGRNMRNPEVLDVAAEVLLTVYPNAWDGQIDTLSWLSRAIGQSKNGRYYSVLQEVKSGAPHKKLAKHAKKALKELGGEEGKQYTKGMVSIPKKNYE